jgi:polyferredoxin
VANTGAFLGTGILQPWVGWTIDRAVKARSAGTSLTPADYQAGIWILFTFAALGFVASLYIRETYCRYAQVH